MVFLLPIARNRRRIHLHLSFSTTAEDSADLGTGRFAVSSFASQPRESSAPGIVVLNLGFK